MLRDAKRVLFTTVYVVENCGLTCLTCILGFFELSNLQTRACFYGTQSCDFLISDRSIASSGTFWTLLAQRTQVGKTSQGFALKSRTKRHS